MRTSLSLCTWNIEFGKKITEIIKLMATDSHFQNLDFLVLQEASIHNGTEDAKIIADILGPEYDYFQVTAHKLRGCVQANAFIWNKNALTVKGKEAIPLPQWKETSGLPRREKVFLRLLPKQLRNSLVVEATFKKFSIRIYAAHLDVLAASANRIIFIEPKLDKRTSATQKLLKDKRIIVKEFAVPEGEAFTAWITDRVKQRGGKIELAATRALAARLAGEPADGYAPAAPSHNLWQAANEIDKLLEYAAGEPISAAAVEALITANEDIEVWKVINAIADRNASGVQDYLRRFFSAEDGSDEKTKVIQLNALLADQFRSIVMVQGFSGQRLSDAVILKLTAWKQGRLFVMKKIAQRCKPELALDVLKKFEHLDVELKTGSTPPRVLLDLILSQVLS